MTNIFLVNIPDWKTYFARLCISSAGQVGGIRSSASRLKRKVNSNPKPLGPSSALTLKKIMILKIKFLIYIKIKSKTRFLTKTKSKYCKKTSM